MKIVINVCYGGFSLSNAAVRRYAELKGRPCFFFRHPRKPDGGIDFGRYEPCGDDEDSMFVTAFDNDHPKPGPRPEQWHKMTDEQRRASNADYSAHVITNRPDDRADPDLVRVVEEMGESANGAHAELRIVEIPDGCEWEIEEYDGNEHVAEKHRTWW